MYPGVIFANPDWPGCLNDQCLEGPCLQGICSRKCTPAKDDMRNGTTEASPDGIEDPDTTNSQCVTDVASDMTFSCVQTSINASGFCYPYASFRACTRTADCDQGETCGFLPVRGLVEPHCLAWKIASAGVGDACGVDDDLLTWTRCTSGNCTDDGCTQACVSDDDCTAQQDACEEDGFCAGSNTPCTAPGDCAAWQCNPALLIDSPAAIVSACEPRVCSTDADCPGTHHYCRNDSVPTSVIGGPVAGRCVMRLDGGAALGSVCNATPDDGLPDTVCADEPYCIDGHCSAMCLTDTDCSNDQTLRCGLDETALDLDSNDQTDSYLTLAHCVFVGSDGAQCQTQTDCNQGVCTPWLRLTDSGTHEIAGNCMTSPVGTASIGSPCGDAAFGMRCDTRQCLEDRSDEGTAGYCSHLCRDDADCPGILAVGARLMAWRCEGMVFGHAGTTWADDDLFAAWCRAFDATSSFEDCSADKHCTIPTEICVPSVRAGFPATGATLTSFCIVPSGGIQAGGSCDPTLGGEDCQTGLCSTLTASRSGFCSIVCSSNEDCADIGGGLAVCDSGPLLPSLSESEPIVVARCRISAACVVCNSDLDCASGYQCVNVSANPSTPDYRCAKTCTDDANCLGSDAVTTCTVGTPPGIQTEVVPQVCLPLACPYAM